VAELDLAAIEARARSGYGMPPDRDAIALVAEVRRLRKAAGRRLSWAIFAVRDHDAYAQPFCLVRETDVSGVSGTGIVADGVAFPDGTVALRWRGGNPTSVVFHDNGIESVEAIHGHGGATHIVWLAEDLETTTEVAATYDARDEARAAIARVEALCARLDAIPHGLVRGLADTDQIRAALRGTD